MEAPPAAVLRAFRLRGDPSIERLAHGLSGATVYRVRDAAGVWAIRRGPSGRRDADRLDWIGAVVKFAHAAGCDFLAPPRRTTQGARWCDHGDRLWTAGPWKPGEAHAETPPRLEFAARAAAALAQLHAVWRDHDDAGAVAPPPVLDRSRRTLARLLGSDAAQLREAVGRAPSGPLGSNAVEMLEAATKLARETASSLAALVSRRRRLQPCLRDARAEHFLFQDEVVSGVIDYDAAAIDSPLGDLARLASDFGVVDSPAWAAAATGYQLVQPLSEEDLAVVRALSVAAPAAAAANWLAWLYVDGVCFHDRAAVRRRTAEIGQRLLAQVGRG